MLSPGTVLNDRYTIQSLIARGGMGAIYMAIDSHLPGSWVVKEMNDIFPNPDDRASIIEQFRREASILSTLNHENLPKVIDYFSMEDAHYIVEEYLPGITLAQMAHQELFSEEAALTLGCQMLRVLHYLHSNNIIYRDLKPQNIMACPSGQYKLIDFGIARLYSIGKRRDTVLMGTPGFAAPEHYGNQQTDVRSDIYGLAATLHYLVTGRDPADSPFRFQPPYILNPGVSKWFSDILMVSLEPRPEDRFSNAMEMLEAMEGPRGVAIKAKEYHYPEKLTLFPRKDRPLQIFAGLTAVTGIGLTVLTGFVPFSMGAGWIAGMALNNRIRNHMKSQTAFISTPRELMIKYRHKVDQIPWENIQVVKVVKYQSMMRSKRTQDDQAHDDTIRVGTVEIFYVKGSGHMAHNFLSKFPADYLYSFKGLWMEKVHFTSEMQSWEELLKTILTRGKLKSTGTPGNPLADEVYIR